MSFKLLEVQCTEEKREILIAELSLFDFDAFEETASGFIASCDPVNWQQEIEEVLDRYQVQYKVSDQEKINWNQEWEKNYDPVIIEDQCIVRASFHPSRPDFSYEIIVTPKMSFGTGHHATTYQVLKYQMQLDFKNKKVLDVGCGTGVLAIMAHKLGARDIYAIDIDEWCIENSQENFALNSCQEVEVELGGIDVVSTDNRYDVILANINKNVLLDQIRDYNSRLAAGGLLIMSGFYSTDIPDLKRAGEEVGLKFIDQSERDKWAMLVMNKPS